ncbi:hypothetical protein K9M48_05285 [Candidatus Gracilibacteria bacterium]|nr:hypothetical protein [Candidatus Gracilibacteria bacterium]
MEGMHNVEEQKQIDPIEGVENKLDSIPDIQKKEIGEKIEGKFKEMQKNREGDKIDDKNKIENKEDEKGQKEIKEKINSVRNFISDIKLETKDNLDRSLPGAITTSNINFLETQDYNNLSSEQMNQVLEKNKSMQSELGYGPDSNNFYNPEHRKDMKEADGEPGPFTLSAINNMIANKLNGRPLEKNILSGNTDINRKACSDFVGTLYPYFYDKFDRSNSKEAGDIVDSVCKIKEGTATKEDISNMQAKLEEGGFYPSSHKSSRDGEPGAFTQVALQNFVLKNFKNN